MSMSYRARWVLLSVVPLAACKNGVKEDVLGNQAPSVEITSPVSSDRLLAEIDNTLVGKVSDDSTPNGQIEVTWFAGVREICPPAFATADGTTTCVAQLQPLEFDITLMARDAEGLAASDQARVSIAPLNAPTAGIRAVETLQDGEAVGSAVYADEPLRLSGRVADADDPPEALLVRWELEGLGQLDGSTVGPDASGEVVFETSLAAVVFPPGEPVDTADPGPVAPVYADLLLSMVVEDTTQKTATDTTTLRVFPTNTAPTGAITRPSENSATVPGTEAVLDGTCTDPNVAAAKLQYRWLSDLRDGSRGQRVLTTAPDSTDGWLPMPASGRAVFSDTTLERGVHELTIDCRDELGAVGSMTRVHTIGTPPTVVISAPTGTNFNEDETKDFVATVSDPDIAGATPEVVTWQLTTDNPPSGDGHVIASGLAASPDGVEQSVTITVPLDMSLLNPGRHTLRFTASDSTGLDVDSSSRTKALFINQLPTQPVISLSPDPANTTQELVLTVPTDPSDPGTSVDPDNGPSALTVVRQWTRDGVPYTPRTLDRVPAADTQRGEVWSVTVLALDGAGTSEAVTRSVTIANSLPTVASATISPGSPVEADGALTCSAGALFDADGDPVSLRYTWQVGGVDVVGATTSSLSNTFWNKGNSVTCTITPFDGIELGTAAVSSSVVVTNSVPSVSAGSITPSSPQAGNTVTCNFSYTDADFAADPRTDADQSEVEWEADGVVLPVRGTGSGSTLSSGFFFPDVLICRVRPFDGTGYGATREYRVNVRNTPPVLDGVTLTPDPAAEGSTLSCVRGNVTDNDDPARVAPYTFDYAWTVNGVPAVGETGPTLGSDKFNRDNAVVCTVTPRDATEAGLPVSSAPLTITNSAPSVASVAISPSPAFEGDGSLSCSASGVNDLDGDTVVLEYGWVVNSAVVPSISSTLSSSFWSHGDVVVCTITPHEFTLSGPAGGAVSSIPLTVRNTTPVVSAVAISPEPAVFGDTLRCDWTFTDADLDPDVSVVSWTINGVPVSSGSLRTIDHLNDSIVGGFDYNDVVVCSVSPNDGTAFAVGASATGTTVSDSLTISNTPPVLASALVSPDPAVTTSTMTCSHPAATDVDALHSGTISYVYRWLLNGTTIAGQTASTLGSAFFLKNQAVRCGVTPTDGVGAGLEVLSNSVTVSNSPPVVLSAAISPPVATEGVTLSCDETGKTDADGDTVTLAYTWSVAGSVVSGQTSRTLSSAFFSAGQSIVCTITPNDGTVSGATVASSGISVANTPPVASAVTVTGVGTASPTIARFGDTVLCDWTFVDIDGDADLSVLTWTINGSPVGGSSTVSTSAHPGDTLAGGFDFTDVVACAVSPRDATGTGTTVNGSLTIANTPPTLTAATLTPGAPFTTSLLTCTPGTTADVDAIRTLSTRYRWFRNGAVLVGETTSTLSSSLTTRGNTIQCEARPFDGTDEGSAVLSATVTILNSLPVLGTASLSPSPAFESSTVSCAASSTTDADSDAVTIDYSWTVDAVVLAVPSTTSALTGASFSRGSTVSCTMTPRDSSGSGTAVSSTPITVQNSVPSVSAVTISPSSATSTTTLSCSYTFADADPGDTDSSTIQWRRGATVIGTGPTLSSTSGVPFAGGDTVTCRVTPNDGTAAGTAVDATRAITNTAPVLASVTLSSSTTPPYETSTLTCTPGSTTDVDGTTSFTYTTSWTRNGAVISGATGTTLTGANFTKNDIILCRMIPVESPVIAGGVSAAMVSSSALSIENSLPTLGAVTVTPASPKSSHNLTCNTAGLADADPGDTASVSSFSWTKNGAVIAGQTAATLNKNQHQRGDSVFCSVVLTDGAATSGPFDAAAVNIANDAPTATAAITPGAPSSTSTLTCTTTTADEDGDTVSISAYAWLVNGAVVSGATSSTLSSSGGVPFAGGDSVVCRATPNDGFIAGTAADSSAVTIANAAPTLASATLSASPSPAKEGSTLTCAGVGAADPDGTTSFTYTYTWRNGVTTIGAAERALATLTSAEFNKGDSITCRVTAYDPALAASNVAVSPAVVIQNTVPTVALSATPSAAAAVEASTLNPGAVASDVDPGDVAGLTLGYAWTVAGSPIAPTTATLTGAHFARGNVVQVTVTPNDGAAGTLASFSWTIQNTAPGAPTVLITPAGAAAAGAVLTCNANATDGDAADALTYSYQWAKGGVNVGTLVTGAGTSSTTTAAGVTVTGGDVMTCTVTATDGTASGASGSASKTITNSAPAVSVVALTSSSSTAREASTLTCTPSVTDADGTTTFTYDYTWKNGATTLSSVTGSAATTATLTGATFNKGMTVTCEVIAHDATSASASVASTGVAIDNTSPVVSAVALLSAPSDAREASTLTCTPTVTDADGDVLTYDYLWKDGATTLLSAPGTSSTSSPLTGADFSKGMSVTCTVMAHDPADASAAVASTAVAILNTAPVAPGALLSSNATPDDEPDTAAVLTCSVATPSTDADGDTVTYAATWERNGVAYAVGANISTVAAAPALTGNTLGAAATADGDDWTCIVTASDGDSGTSTDTDTLNIYYEVGQASDTGKENVAVGTVRYVPVVFAAASEVISLRASIEADTTGTPSVNLGLYDNDGTSGRPLTRLGKGAAAVAVTAASNYVLEIDLESPVSVTAGTYYIAVYADAAVVLERKSAAGNVDHYTQTASSLPATAATGASLTIDAAKNTAVRAWVY